MEIFHIRAPQPRKGANRFYPVGSPRIQKTLCGAPTTHHDDKFSWQAVPVGNYTPCPECVRIKAEVKNHTSLQQAADEFCNQPQRRS